MRQIYSESRIRFRINREFRCSMNRETYWRRKDRKCRRTFYFSNIQNFASVSKHWSNNENSHLCSVLFTILLGLSVSLTFSSSWTWLRDHTLQHLRSTDHSFTSKVTLCYEHLLCKEYLEIHIFNVIPCKGATSVTFSGGISIPRSPRATITPSAASTISSAFVTPSSHSIFAMILIFLPLENYNWISVLWIWSQVNSWL